MSKFFKKVCVTTLVLLLFSLHSLSFAESIEKYTGQIVINTDGTIKVSEEILYDFGSLQRHGIYRKIPFVKQNTAGKKFDMRISDVKVADTKNNPVNFTQTKNSSDLVLKIGDADKTITGSKVYKISYTVSGALTYFSDHDELYWNFVGNSWEVPVEFVDLKITLPNGISANDIQTACYTGALNSTNRACSAQTSNNIVYIKSSTALPAGHGLTIVIGFPKNIVALIEPQVNNDESNAAVFFVILCLIGFVWYVVTPIKVAASRARNKKFLKDNQQIVAAWFDPPKDKENKPLTPAETGCLIDKVADKREVTATIIHLAQRGYLRLEIQDTKVLGFIKSPTPTILFRKLRDFTLDQTLTSYESTLLNALFSDQNSSLLGMVSSFINLSFNTSTTDQVLSTQLKSNYFAQKISNFITQVEAVLGSKKMFDGSFTNARATHIALLTFGAITFNAPLLLVLLIYRNQYIRFSKDGVRCYSEAVSLKNFLVSQDAQLDYQAQNQMFFEKLLPYATAFGVEDVWAKRFAHLQFTQSDWIQNNTSSLYNAAFLSSAISHSLVPAISSGMTPTSSSSGFSSGFSGGSSGGGGGGGGGGSW